MTNDEKNKLKKIKRFIYIYILTTFAVIALIGMVWCTYKG